MLRTFPGFRPFLIVLLLYGGGKAHRRAALAGTVLSVAGVARLGF